MPLAQLTVELPERTWIHEVSTAHPEATFRVLAVMPDDDAGVALLQLQSSEWEPVIRAMTDSSQVTEMRPIQQLSEQVIVQIETIAPLLLSSAQASGVPIEPPVVIRDGTASVEVRTAPDRLSELGDQLERFGLSYTVDAVHDDVVPDQLLSPRQRELLLAAVKHGYYDSPRRCTLTELAVTVDIAKSTCSETLHRAEGLIVRRFVDQHLAVSD